MDESEEIEESITLDTTSDVFSIDGTRAYWCDECSVSFGHIRSKNAHVKKFHAPIQKMFECAYCDMQSLYVHNVITHHESFHKDLPKPNVKNVPFHQIQNTENRKLFSLLQVVFIFHCFYILTTCISLSAFLFTVRKDNLNKNPPNSKGPLPKSCEICGKTFKNGTKHLNVHLRKAHNVEIV